MLDDLVIPNTFCSELLTAFFVFPKNFFSYLCELVQRIRRAYTDHVT